MRSRGEGCSASSWDEGRDRGRVGMLLVLLMVMACGMVMVVFGRCCRWGQERHRGLLHRRSHRWRQTSRAGVVGGMQ